MFVVDVLGERPARISVYSQSSSEAKRAWPSRRITTDVSERRPHQVAELVGRAKAKRRTERLGRPIADLLSEQLNHRRIAW